MARRKKVVDDTIQVKIKRLLMPTIEVTLNGERSVEDALEAAGLYRKAGEAVRINGEEVNADEYELEDGDVITLVNNIRGA